MFRLSGYMRELLEPTAVRHRRPPGPVVIWNLVRRCNLNCLHCYSLSCDVDFPGELSTEEVFTVMDDLKAFGVPVLILSGGEPLLRPDIFEISKRAKALGFYVGLSSNGTLIDKAMSREIAEVGYDYVGISLDGIGEVHDAFRRQEGSYEAALKGMRLCPGRGHQGGPALHHDRAQREVLGRDAGPGRRRGDRQVLPLAPGLCRPRQPLPRGRRLSPHHPRVHGPDLRALLGLRPARGRRRSSSPATTMPTGSISCNGSPSAFRRNCPTSEPSSKPGAAMPRASTSPTSTIWA